MSSFRAQSREVRGAQSRPLDPEDLHHVTERPVLAPPPDGFIHVAGDDGGPDIYNLAQAFFITFQPRGP